MDYQIRVEWQEHRIKIDTGTDVTARICLQTRWTIETDQLGTERPQSTKVRCMRAVFRKTFKPISIHSTRDLCYLWPSQALLGRPAIEALQVVQKVNLIQINSIVKQFPELFQELGRLKDNYKIKLLSEAKPFALTTPR